MKMTTNGLSTHTITRTRKILAHLSRYTDLDQPEQIREYVATHNVSNATKKHMIYAYDKYAKHYNITWEKPKYKPQSKAVKVPTKEKAETLVKSAKQPLCLKLGLSYETGLRPVEIFNLKVKDADLEQQTIYPTTAKNGAPRKIKISTFLKDQLQTYITNHHLAQNDNLFKGNSAEYGRNFRARALGSHSLDRATLGDISTYLHYAKLGILGTHVFRSCLRNFANK
jgi:integrase